MGSQTDTTEHHTPPPGKKATWSQSLATDSSCSLGGNIGFLLEEGSLDGKKKKVATDKEGGTASLCSEISMVGLPKQH